MQKNLINNMRKYVIPGILVLTILVSGVFAFSPIEQAATVHTTIQASTDQTQVRQFTIADINGNGVATIDCATDTWILEALTWDVSGAVFGGDETATIAVGGLTVGTATTTQAQATQGDLLATLEITSLPIIAGDNVVVTIVEGAGDNTETITITATITVNGGAADCTIV